MEHRWGKRQITDVGVRFVAATAKIGTGRLLNMSTSGAYLATPMNLRVLTLVYLACLASRSAKIRVNGMPAYVVRLDAFGLGLEWCESSAGKMSIAARLAILTGEAAADSAAVSWNALPHPAANSQTAR